MANREKGEAFLEMERKIKLLSDEMMENPDYKRLRKNMGLPDYEPYFPGDKKPKRAKGGYNGKAVMKKRGGTFKGTF
jgi:hypothetical protein